MFDEISGIRWVGILIGIIISLSGIRQFRHYREGRGTALMMLGLGTMIFLVAVFPQLGRIPAELFSLTRIKGGVLISLLLIAVTVLSLLVLWNRHKIDYIRRRLNDTIHGLAVNQFISNHSSDDNTESHIIWAVIPAFNEVENIPHTLSQMPKMVCGYPLTVLLVDDGSTDGTGSAAHAAGAQVLRMPANTGQGSAFRAGYDIAIRSGATIVVTLDADGQNLPGEIENVVQPLINDEADVVIGSRILGEHEHTSIARSVGVHIFNLILSMMTGRKITDCASSFRAFTAPVLRQVILDQEQYQSTEILIEAAKREYRITERPITFCRRKFGSSKKGGNLLYGFLFFRTIIKTWLR